MCGTVVVLLGPAVFFLSGCEFCSPLPLLPANCTQQLGLKLPLKSCVHVASYSLCLCVCWTLILLSFCFLTGLCFSLCSWFFSSPLSVWTSLQCSGCISALITTVSCSRAFVRLCIYLMCRLTLSVWLQLFKRRNVCIPSADDSMQECPIQDPDISSTVPITGVSNRLSL